MHEGLLKRQAFGTMNSMVSELEQLLRTPKTKDHDPQTAKSSSSLRLMELPGRLHISYGTKHPADRTSETIKNFTDKLGTAARTEPSLEIEKDTSTKEIWPTELKHSVKNKEEVKIVTQNEGEAPFQIIRCSCELSTIQDKMGKRTD